MSAQVAFPAASANLPKKEMRKGTRSCFECRRRKIRCIFEEDHSKTCRGCKKTGSQCFEQKRDHVKAAAVDSRVNLKTRVAKLEAIIESLAPGASDLSTNRAKADERITNATPPPLTASTVSPSSTRGVDSLVPFPDSFKISDVASNKIQSVDPIDTIFNNAVWKSDKKRDCRLENISEKMVEKSRHTRESLIAGLLSYKLLVTILDEAGGWWYTWKFLRPWQFSSFPDQECTTLRQFVALGLNSDDPSIVGLAVLFISISIRQLNDRQHQHIICQLPRSAGVLFKEYFELVQTLIVNDGDYASTREGIEVIVMSGDVLMNFGMIKKTWILLRKAISYSQLLSLQCPGLLDGETDEDRTRRHRSWIQLVETDVYKSLLLGLPCSTDCRTMPASLCGDPGTVPFFRSKLLDLSIRVIDTQQLGTSNSSEITQQIQFEIESLGQSMSPTFWRCQAALKSGDLFSSDHMSTITCQFWYHQVKISLHLPLMIRSLEDKKFEIHRTCCIQASRDFLELYRGMRLEKSGTFELLKVIDYQAFICSALLALGIIGREVSGPSSYSDQNLNDRGLLEATIAVVRHAVTSYNSTVSSQTLQGLEMLSAMSKWDVRTPRVKTQGETCRISVTVPYGGKILISPGAFLKCEEVGSQQALPDPEFELQQVFTLLDNDSASYSGQSQNFFQAGESGVSSRGYEGWNENAALDDVHFIDLDWGSLTNMNTDDDWAWLNDVSRPGGMMDF